MTELSHRCPFEGHLKVLEESIEAFPWLEKELGSEALESITAFADKWTVDNETAGMQALAEHLKQTILAGPPPEREEAQGITLAAAARRIMQLPTCMDWLCVSCQAPPSNR
eukprot:1161716-Pelagomonas_calceolata.AAC.8